MHDRDELLARVLYRGWGQFHQPVKAFVGVLLPCMVYRPPVWGIREGEFKRTFL